MDTLGRRAVLGVLVPSFNTVVQPELDDLRPRGVTNQVGRFRFDATLLESIQEEARKLTTAHAAALIVGLAAEGIPGGLAVLEQGARDLAEATGLPISTASHATHAALRALGVRRVALVTPFTDEENGNARAAFAEHGFEVVGDHALACPALDRIGETSEGEIRRAFSSADVPEAEALVHVGTGLPVVGLVAELERVHGKPVVACNAASYWQALRAVGITDPIDGFGCLLRAH